MRRIAWRTSQGRWGHVTCVESCFPCGGTKEGMENRGTGGLEALEQEAAGRGKAAGLWGWARGPRSQGAGEEPHDADAALYSPLAARCVSGSLPELGSEPQHCAGSPRHPVTPSKSSRNTRLPIIVLSAGFQVGSEFQTQPLLEASRPSLGLRAASGPTVLLPPAAGASGWVSGQSARGAPGCRTGGPVLPGTPLAQSRKFSGSWVSGPLSALTGYWRPRSAGG